MSDVASSNTPQTNSTTKPWTVAALVVGGVLFVGSTVGKKIVDDFYDAAKPTVIAYANEAGDTAMQYSWLVNYRYYNGDLAAEEKAVQDALQVAALEKETQDKIAAQNEAIRLENERLERERVERDRLEQERLQAEADKVQRLAQIEGFRQDMHRLRHPEQF